MPQPAPETLYALGLPRWRLRARAGSGAGEMAQATGGVAAVTDSEPAVAASRAGAVPPASTLAAASLAVSAPTNTGRSADVVETLEALRAEVAGCQACALAGGRTQTVFGNGNPHARWMFIGEAPGAAAAPGTFPPTPGSYRRSRAVSGAPAPAHPPCSRLLSSTSVFFPWLLSERLLHR